MLAKPEELRFAEARVPILAVESWSSVSRTITIAVTTRNAMYIFKHSTRSDRGRGLDSWRIDEIPTNVEALITGTTGRRGETFARVTLELGGSYTSLLFQGYIYGQRRMNWPPVMSEEMTQGPGLLRSITGTDPAAGAEISETVPTNARWKLRGMVFTLVADGTVVTRYCNIVIEDGAIVMQRLGSSYAHNAGVSAIYSLVPGVGVSGDQGAVIIIPAAVDTVLFQSWRVRTITSNLQAGDDYGAPQMLVEEWLEE